MASAVSAVRPLVFATASTAAPTLPSNSFSSLDRRSEETRCACTADLNAAARNMASCGARRPSASPSMLKTRLLIASPAMMVRSSDSFAPKRSASVDAISRVSSIRRVIAASFIEWRLNALKLGRSISISPRYSASSAWHFSTNSA